MKTIIRINRAIVSNAKKVANAIPSSVSYTIIAVAAMFTLLFS